MIGPTITSSSNIWFDLLAASSSNIWFDLLAAGSSNIWLNLLLLVVVIYDWTYYY